MDKLGELIKEIAHKHGVAVGKSDPILIVHTMNESLLRESAEHHKALLSRFQQELEMISHHWECDAKAKAERMLNAALSASSEAMQKVMCEGARATAESVRMELEKASAKIAADLRDSKRVALLNLLAASLAVLAAGLVLFIK